MAYPRTGVKFSLSILDDVIITYLISIGYEVDLITDPTGLSNDIAAIIAEGRLHRCNRPEDQLYIKTLLPNLNNNECIALLEIVFLFLFKLMRELGANIDTVYNIRGGRLIATWGNTELH